MAVSFHMLHTKDPAVPTECTERNLTSLLSLGLDGLGEWEWSTEPRVVLPNGL